MMKKIIFAIIIVYIIGFGLLMYSRRSCFPYFRCQDKIEAIEKDFDLKQVQISGWIPWWKEKEAHTLISLHASNLVSVSSVWFYVDEDLMLEERGSSKSSGVGLVQEYKQSGLEVIPTLASDLTGDELSEVFNRNNEFSRQFQRDLVNRLIELDADGLDVNLEGISEKDKDAFVGFLQDLGSLLHSQGLKLVVTVHAQTGSSSDGKISKGQDLGRISNVADEVRVMVYDRHGVFSNPGPISPYEWMVQVISYSLRHIQEEKLVIGVPSYGYVWEENGDAHGLQYDEFNRFLENHNRNTYSVTRDPLSGELVYESQRFTGWLSDSESMIKKMTLAKAFGLDRFVIWSLGGIDSTLFEKIESSEDPS